MNQTTDAQLGSNHDLYGTAGEIPSLVWLCKKYSDHTIYETLKNGEVVELGCMKDIHHKPHNKPSAAVSGFLNCPYMSWASKTSFVCVRFLHSAASWLSYKCSA